VRGACRLLILLAIGVEALGAEVTRQGPLGRTGRPLGHTYRSKGRFVPATRGGLAALFEADRLNPESPVRAIAKGRGILPLLFLELDSAGGDTEEAMRLGRWLRGRWGGAGVMAGDRCVSACVLVLAGAVVRETAGRSWCSASGSTRPTSPRCTSLRALGPASSRVAREDSLSPRRRRGGSCSVDLRAREERTAAQARRYGLTSSELLRRFAETQVACGTEERVNRQVATLELDPLGSSRASALWGDWYECRWRAMGRRAGRPTVPRGEGHRHEPARRTVRTARVPPSVQRKGLHGHRRAVVLAAVARGASGAFVPGPRGRALRAPSAGDAPGGARPDRGPEGALDRDVEARGVDRPHSTPAPCRGRLSAGERLFGRLCAAILRSWDDFFPRMCRDEKGESPADYSEACVIYAIGRSEGLLPERLRSRISWEDVARPRLV